MKGLWSSRIPVALAEIREFLGEHGAPPFALQLAGTLDGSPTWTADPADPLSPTSYNVRYTVGGPGAASTPFCTIIAVDPQVRARKGRGFLGEDGARVRVARVLGQGFLGKG